MYNIEPHKHDGSRFYLHPLQRITLIIFIVKALHLEKQHLLNTVSALKNIKHYFLSLISHEALFQQNESGISLLY